MANANQPQAEIRTTEEILNKGIIKREKVESATIRFAGDSGDGVQLAGSQFTSTVAVAGNDLATFPDYPAEIRAPRGTLSGVSGFQLQFAAREVYTPGDKVDVLVAFNPAALKQNVADLKPQGTLIVDQDAFDRKGLKLARYEENPLENDSLREYNVFKIPLTTLTRDAVAELGLGKKQSEQGRNFFAMGLVYWLYDRSLEVTERFVQKKFGALPAVLEANLRSLKAGWHYGETVEAQLRTYEVPAAKLEAGTYRNLTGNRAMALGLITAAKRSGKKLFYASYPITPASDILHEISRHRGIGVSTFQAEDEIAAISAAIGAAYGGSMAVTASAGPGIALKSEAMGLAVMLELPLVILNVQRGGPSTGLPTKTEQSDLLQVMYNRSGEAPLPILAACGPADCFEVVQEAWEIAVKLMTPVIVLSDAFVANGAEPWLIPDVKDLKKISIEHPGEDDAEDFFPYRRDTLLSRPWAIPGTKGLMHRLGGLEKKNITGEVSYDADNHESMVRLRAHKIDNAEHLMGKELIFGDQHGDMLVVSWGGTYGACHQGVKAAVEEGFSVTHLHLRHLYPLPSIVGKLIKHFKKVLIPELNSGQLRQIIRSTYLVDAIGLNKIQGRPFTVDEVKQRIVEILS